MSPASALPSFNLYRGSLLALLVGTAVALWLLVRPPGSGEEAVVVAGVTPTGIVTEVDEGTSTPRLTPSPTAGTATPAGTATSTPGPTAATATPAPQTYEVQEGDTLLSIAEEHAPPGVDPVDYAERIAAANGISSDDIINPGEELILP
jgi:LysM repeat protein